MMAHGVGSGKAQPLDAKILTPTGWTTMGEIRAGDKVIAANGKPTEVTAVYPQGEKEIFKITFDDGTSTECCKEHLWETQTYYERTKESQMHSEGKTGWDCAKPKVRSTEELMGTLTGRLDSKNHTIPLVSPIEFEEQDVPLHPYMVGFLIGDGSLTAKRAAFSTSDNEIVRLITNLVPRCCNIKKASGDNYDYFIRTGGKKGPKASYLTQSLRDLGLAGKKLHPNQPGGCEQLEFFS